PAAVQSAVDLAGRENKAAALAQGHELFHRHHDHMLRGSGKRKRASISDPASALVRRKRVRTDSAAHRKGASFRSARTLLVQSGASRNLQFASLRFAIKSLRGT